MAFRLLLSILLVAMVPLSSCSRQKAEAPPARPPALVALASARQQDVPQLLKAVGTMEASESVSVKSQISGELTRVAFREGQDVQRGALLFQIDPRPFQAALKKAEAALARDRVVMENARANYERYRQLVRDGIVTQEQAEGYRTVAESAAASVASDQAEVDNARTQLAYCTITAPVSGRLGALAVDRGNVVKANETTLVTINRVTPINAVFTIPEKELAEVRRQMAAGRVAVEAEVSGGAGFRENGALSFVDNTVDTATGTIRLKGVFDNRQKRLWPGQFVTLAITLAMRSNAVVVPSHAVQTGQKGQFVFVAKPDGTAELRPVSAGVTHQGMTVIDKGVQAGEQVVIDGQMRVVPGGKLQVAQAAGANPGPAKR